MSAKFRIGDRVVNPFGVKGEVTDVETNEIYMIGGSVEWWQESELELVKEEPKQNSIPGTKSKIHIKCTCPKCLGIPDFYEEEPKMKEWPCEHRDSAVLVDCEIFRNTQKTITIAPASACDSCPFCGAKRPEPKEETLEDVIERAIHKPLSVGFTPTTEAMARAIREHLKSKEGEIINFLAMRRTEDASSDLTKQILKILGI